MKKVEEEKELLKKKVRELTKNEEKLNEEICDLKRENAKSERKNKRNIIKHIKLRKKMYIFSEDSLAEEKEKDAQKKATKIFVEFALIFLLYFWFVYFVYSCIDKQYKSYIMGLGIVLVTFCFEPYFKSRTNKYADEHFKRYFDFKLQTLKIAWFAYLSIFYTLIFTLLSSKNIERFVNAVFVKSILKLVKLLIN